jgi:hypothetical protein
MSSSSMVHLCPPLVLNLLNKAIIYLGKATLVQCASLFFCRATPLFDLENNTKKSYHAE